MDRLWRRFRGFSGLGAGFKPKGGNPDQGVNPIVAFEFQGRQFIRTERLKVFQFVTVHTHAQQPLLTSVQAKQLLLAKLHEAKEKFKLEIAGYVVLDDHFHFLCATKFLMEIEAAVDLLCKEFTFEWRRRQDTEGRSPAEMGLPIWGRDILSHRLTLVNELHPHLNFIHYDPVRHGYVERAADYPWSSLPARVDQGYYPEDWAVQAPPAGMAKVARGVYLSP